METCKYSEAGVAFVLEPSPRLAAFIVLSAAATVAIVIAMPLPAWISAAAVVWSVVACLHALGGAMRRHAVRIQGGTPIVVDGKRGDIVSGSFVAPWLTIVHWRPARARFTRTLVVLPDMIDRDRFRELRVILRWAPPP